MSKVLQEIKKTEPVATKPGELPKGVRNLPAWGNLPTIPVEKGVVLEPPRNMNEVYDIDIDTAVPGAIDNGCAILANIMDDPSAGEKAKAIILEAKKDNPRANFQLALKVVHHISVAGPKSNMAYITIN